MKKERVTLVNWDGKRFRAAIPISAASAFLVTGCDPVVGIAGATFPIWLLCMAVGILSALCLRAVFAAIGIDQWLAPRLLVYSSLALTIAFLCWLASW